MADTCRNHLEKVLKQIIVEYSFVDPSITVTPISSDGANYTSKLFSVAIKDSEKDFKLFSKVIDMGEKLRAQVPLIYEIEICAYTKLSNVFEVLQQDVPGEHRFSFPKFYGGSSKLYEEVIVIEDLVAQGFSTYDRLKSVDWPYASSAVQELAKMHALSFAYREAYPEEFYQLREDLKLNLGSFGRNLTFCFGPVNDMALSSVRKENKEKLRAYFDRFDMAEFRTATSPILVHGDYKPSNLMHKLREDGTIDIKIIDLQTLQGGSPIVDLLYFIFTGSDEQFRAEHYSCLVDHYYSELRAAMSRLQLKPAQIYSKDQFYRELEKKLHYGLAIAVFSLPFLTVETENAHVVSDDTDMAGFFSVKTSALYAERLNGVVDDFVRWGVL